ncbi:zinc finger protein DHHC domain-containing protein [Theileria equi strain WA]|uniref:Palmitoyltransferase n=1 Tax=Theileria equi strain WA TaxID=1537102 RepID=L0B055_THEEQ|nr:zinc finger protein DHHC domain-containing protein [Theileria equi strain WA]AFZ81237.1 zinc finger protein DHHC domain-containing protein [Theileria equi strain WA]|eukprot:XP_004830903.1 zinc finger protein DHHC domain-containing protein [Theileria equi strain WA]
MLDQSTAASQSEAPAKPVKKRGTCFRNIAYMVMLYMYFGMMGILLRPYFHPLTFYGGSMTIGFNVIFLLFFISFVRSSNTDPGVVPVNWGFYMGDDTKRRRYCKVCNVWKPDRTHHCSACNRCVLNMDHHCPWINNCVGFYNRKYFMQLLVYAVLGLMFTVFHSICFLINETFMESPPAELYPSASDTGFKAASYIYVCVMIFVGLGLIFALIPFVQFHFRLVLKNSTTIENMDEASRDSGMYDMGIGANLQQVFGVNPLCWFAPCNLPLNRPVGDGVRWSQYYYTNIPNEP